MGWCSAMIKKALNYLVSGFDFFASGFDNNVIPESHFPYPSAFAFFISLLLFINLLPQFIGFELPYCFTTLAVMCMIVVFYGIVFGYGMIKNKLHFSDRRNLWTMLFSLFISGTVIYYRQVFVYGEIFSIGDYAGVGGFIIGKEEHDLLFHSSLIEAITNYGFPSLLFYGVDFFKYHTGMHFLLGAFSFVTKLPGLYVLHYIFPLITFPLYAGLCFKVVMELRYFFSKCKKLDFYDVFIVSTMVLCTFFVMFPGIFAGIYVLSMFLSVSMVMGMILIFLCTLFTLKAIREKYFDNKLFRYFYFILVLPFFIITGSVAKVTAGLFILGAVTIYFFSRKNSIVTWMSGISAILFYAVIFAVTYKFVAANSLSDSTTFDIVPFAFLRKRFNFIGFIVLLVPVVLFLKECKWSICHIFDGSEIVENMLLGLTLAFWIPPMLIDIAGGSGCFFYMLPYTFAVLGCCASDIPQKLLKTCPERLQNWIKAFWLSGVIVAGIAAVVYYIYPTIYAPRNEITDAGAEKVAAAVLKARKMVKGAENKEKFIAFMDQTSPLLVPAPYGSATVIQSWLGIPVINSFYPDEKGDFVTATADRKKACVSITPLLKYRNGYGYGVDDVRNKVRKFDRESAVDYAKKNGYKYLFLFAEGIRLLDLDTMKEQILCPPGQSHLFRRSKRL